MGDVKIVYQDLERTTAIDSHIHDKFSKLDKFLMENYKATVFIKDETPKKKTKNNEYKVIIDLLNVEKGKNVKYSIHTHNKDLYLGVDENVNKLAEKMRRNHDKKTRNFKELKQKFIEKYISTLKNY